MVDEQQPAKRVVKKVVKKTVARPAAPASQPTVRYGRPVATAAKPAARPAAKATAQPSPTRPAVPASTVGSQKVKRQAPTIDVRAAAAGARDLAGRAWWATADTVADGAHVAGRFVSARARTVAAWRLPHVNAYLASVVTGAVVGLLAVLLATIALAVFDAVRGVSSGGGLWGGIAFVAVSLVSVAAGEALLRGFGTHSPRLTSVLAVILAIIAMLGLFLDVVDTGLGLVLVPLLAGASYVVSHWLIDLAESSPTVVE
jgi:hypothetical protein